MSPLRLSFIQTPAVHPANNRFLTPLFSFPSELLFSQLLSFHKHLHCPLVFFNRALQKPCTSAASAKSFSYRFYAESAANPFIYRIYAKHAGCGGALLNLILSVIDDIDRTKGLRECAAVGLSDNTNSPLMNV